MSSASPATPEEILTEKSAFADLIAWAADRPAWQKDALRRLILNDELAASDIVELTSICMDPKAASQPVTAAHIAADGASGEPIALLGIENPTGVNALAADQKLEFAKSGLTVIYGDNGSGKSGYVRVLKHACRTRDRGTSILRDVEDTTATPQAAKIVFSRGAAQADFSWTPDGAGNPDLPSVSIFDSRSANIHVEKTNAVAYIPQPMRILEALAVGCDKIKENLEAQVSLLVAQTPLALKTPTLRDDTAAGAFVIGLSAKSNLAQLDLLATLSPEEKQRLAALEGDLAQDPKRAAGRIANQKARLDEQVLALKGLMKASDPGAFATRDKLKTELQTKTAAAKAASVALFAASPLPEIGQAVWATLWEAARRYSDKVAYPKKSFPAATVGDDLCVLCQQPLTAEAIQRRLTFETFVKGTTKADADAALVAYTEALATAKAARISIVKLRDLKTFLATEIGDVSLGGVVAECGVRAAWSLRAFVREKNTPGSPVIFPEAALADLSKSLADRVTKLSADQNSPAHIALVREYRELKDRDGLFALVADIKAEIERRKKADALRKAMKDTAKNSVTKKNKDISDKLVTNALRGRFAREIDKMKLARMPIELKKIKDQNAVSYFQVCLVEKPGASVGEIFSEGEHRCVALAAFLAELVTSKQYSGIVFDDPMSSLDHIHRKAIAGRLVEEAEHRQVIVFTHDLTFLYELRREAEAKTRPILYQTVRRKQDRPGYVVGELPNKAKSASQLAHALRTDLKEIKGQFDHLPDSSRTIFCKGFIEQLRETWDQGIADFIFPVLGRFDNHIKGTSLFKLAVLTEEDVKTVTAARGRLSEELHSSAETLNPETVSHATLFAEIGKLDNWLADISLRQKSAKAPVTSYAT